MKVRSAILFAGLTLSMGCTNHLKVARVDSNAPSVSDRSGFPYMLQFTQYKIVLTRRVTGCDSDFTTAIKAEITPELVDDGDYTYVIKSDSLISPTKISDLKVEWENGHLKLINASAEDRTAQTVLSVVQGIGKVARIAAGGGMVGAGGTQEGCSDAVVSQLAAKKTAQSDVDEITSDMVDLVREVTRLKATYIESVGDTSIKRKLAAAVALVDGANARLADAQSRLQKALKFLTYEETIRWPERSDTFRTTTALQPPMAILEKWYDVPRGPGDRDDDAYTARKKAVYSKFLHQMSVHFVIEQVGTYGRLPANPAQADDGRPRDGLRFRLPASGRFVVCEAKQCKGDDTENVVAVHPGKILQLGFIFYAPFSSPPFTNAAFEMAFDTTGTPTKAGISRKTASAETAAGLFKDVAGEAVSIYDVLNVTKAEEAAKRLAALETAKKLADAEAALDPNSPAKVLAALEFQGKLTAATAALVPSPTADLVRLTAIADAQKRYQDALTALAANPNSDRAAQQAAFEADAALLRAQASSLEAEILVRDARKRLSQ
jgi:hypothetical protein